MRRLPVAGHLPYFLRDKLAFLDRCATINEPVIALDLGGPTLLLREPDDIRFALEEHPQLFHKSPRLMDERGQRLSGRGVLTSAGDRHRRLRDALAPLFTRPAISDFVPEMIETAQLVTNAWTDSERNIADDIPFITKCIIGRIVFDADYLNGDRDLADAFLRRKRYLQYRFDYPFFWSEWLPIGAQRRYRVAARFIERDLNRRLANSTPDRACLLNRLREASLNDAEILDEAITLAITGYETLGDALIWALLLLTQHAESRARVRQEARRFFESGDPSADGLPALPYTSLVLLEALRLYPPTWLFIRMALEGVQLPSGYRMRAGDKIYLSPWVVHRDPRFYEEPLTFRPERFRPQAVANRPKLAYFPFGAGSRLCIGHHLAKMEGALLLAFLEHNYDFTLKSSFPEPVGRMTLRPKGAVRMRVERR